MICFLHIEKVAGTTINSIFHNNYLSFVTINPWYKGKFDDEYNYFTAQEARLFFRILPFTKGFSGHSLNSTFKYEQALKCKIEYITFLRDPVERFLSHCFYHKRKKKGSINLFLEDKRFDNFMTKRIAGSPDINKAKKILAEDYKFVGLNERFDESLVLMKNELNLEKFSIFYEKKNVNPNTDYIKDFIFKYKKEMDKIYERNALDIELYNFTKTHICKKYKRNYGPALEKDVSKFREANKNFKFSRIKAFYSIAYRQLLSRHLQSLVHYIVHGRYGD